MADVEPVNDASTRVRRELRIIDRLECLASFLIFKRIRIEVWWKGVVGKTGGAGKDGRRGDGENSIWSCLVFHFVLYTL